MNAGRELDALVAEKVMGLDMTRPDGLKYPIGMPRYSTELVAAWTVVEAVMRRAESVSVLLTEDGACCRVLPHDSDALYIRAYDATAPLAICQAALRFAGAELPA